MNSKNIENARSANYKQTTEWYCRIGFCGSSRFFASQGQDFAAKVHAATYLGNFAM